MEKTVAIILHTNSCVLDVSCLLPRCSQSAISYVRWNISSAAEFCIQTEEGILYLLFV